MSAPPCDVRLWADHLRLDGRYAMRVRAKDGAGRALPFMWQVKDLADEQQRSDLVAAAAATKSLQAHGVTRDHAQDEVDRLLLEAMEEEAAQDAAVAEGSSGGSQADRLVRLARASGTVLFTDQAGEPYVAVNGDGTVVHPLNSRATRRWLAGLMYAAEAKAPGGEGLQSAIITLEALAVQADDRHELEVRVARRGSEVWYDLGRAAVRVAPGSWEVVENPPILFRRYAHQLPQVEPVHGGDFSMIHNFVRLADDDHRLLADVATIAGLVPGSPRPILDFYGPEGSAKTTGAKAIARMLDPSAAPTVRRVLRDDELTQRLSQWWAPVFDNLAAPLPDRMQDALAAACTGDGDVRRTLYTTADSTVIAFRRVIILTGIAVPLTRPDALDRALLLGSERVPEKDRRDEESLTAEIEAAIPSILGGAFDILARAMEILPRVRLATMPRMADFARLGYAIAEAMGFGGGRFLVAYERNRRDKHAEAIAASLVAQAVVKHVEACSGTWEGSPTDLKKALDKLAPELGVDLDDKRAADGWPRTAAALGTTLLTIAATLEGAGVSFRAERSNRGRSYKFVATPREDTQEAVTAVRPSPNEAQHDAGDGYDGQVAPSSGGDASASAYASCDSQELPFPPSAG